MLENYLGMEVVEFISQCPVDKCDNQEEINWRHVGCKKKEYINSEGNIICTDCSKQFGFYEATFNCGSHENYKPASKNPQRLIAAFAMMGRLKSGGGKKFLKKLMNNLLDQCPEDDDEEENKINNNFEYFPYKPNIFKMPKPVYDDLK